MLFRINLKYDEVGQAYKTNFISYIFKGVQENADNQPDASVCFLDLIFGEDSVRLNVFRNPS